MGKFFRLFDQYNETNPVFTKSINLLAHPIVLGILFVAFLNDHFLRVYYPSWFTGKLGDFTWLFLAPIPLVAVISWAFPQLKRNDENFIFGVGAALVSLLFVVMKSGLVLNLMATRIISTTLRTPFVIIPDPTDLIALPALLFCFWIWKQVPAKSGMFGLVVLPLIALLTMANAGMPDPGISCFTLKDQTIIAQAGFSSFASIDGGMTWQANTMGDSKVCNQPPNYEGGWLVISATQENVSYRFQAGNAIERSTDHRKTWNRIYEFRPIPESKKQYYIRSHQGYIEFSPGPFDAIADPKTGNVIFAMGHQGVLLLQQSGDWTWISVGDYQPFVDFPNLDAFGTLLGNTIYLSIAFSLLTLTTLSLRWAGGPLRIIIIVIAWVGWGIVDMVFPPALAANYEMVISGLGIIGIYLLLIPLFIDFSLRLYRHNIKMFLPVFGVSIITGLIFFIPYLLWLFSTLPTLWWATLFGLVSGLVSLLWGFFVVRKQVGPISPRRVVKGDN